MIDLHTHTTASDGSFSPENLILQAAAAGIERLAITDHDCVSALLVARPAARNSGIGLIDGIELSVSWENRTFHIVGLKINCNCLSLQQVIAQAQLTRIQRGHEIGAALEEHGIDNAWQKTRAMADSEALTRSHFARMLVDEGKAKNAKQVFKRYMVKGKPGYVSAEWISMDAAISIIHAAGGVAILAHPARYYLGKNHLARLLDAFQVAGGDAIEVVSGKTNSAEIAMLAQHANKRNLAASIGSDFHGPDKPWLSLGKLPALPVQCDPVWSRFALW